MNILFLTDLIPLDENENCSKALYDIIQSLINNGHNIDVMRPNFLFNSFIRGKFIKPQGEYIFRDLKIKNLNFFTPFLFKPKNINISKYDTVIAHMPSGILFAEKLLENNLKIRKFYAVHQSDIEVLTNPVYSIYFRKKMREAYLHADKILCRSVHLKEKMDILFPILQNKIEFVPHPIKQNDIISKDYAFQKFENLDKLKIITVANLIKRKNIDILIKALDKFSKKDFELQIIGMGVEKKRLQHIVEKSKIKNKINFLDYQTKKNVFEYLKNSHVFILPSIKETLGLAYLEAMSSGCLCVGVRGTGIDGIIINNINGFLLEDIKERNFDKTLNKIFSLTKEDFQNLVENSLKTMEKLSQNTL